MHRDISSNLESNPSASERATGRGINNPMSASKGDTSGTQDTTRMQDTNRTQDANRTEDATWNQDTS